MITTVKAQVYVNHTFSRVLPDAENRRPHFVNDAFGGKVCRRLIQHWRGMAES